MSYLNDIQINFDIRYDIMLGNILVGDDLMKETIYTIPINEAFALDVECPFCYIEDNLEKKYLSAALGAALMEPDTRVDMNSRGFCRHHYESMFNSKENILGLSLVMETFYKSQIGILEKWGKNSPKAMKDVLNDCHICNDMNFTMERYIDNCIFMWKDESDFRNLFESKKGFCIKHFLHLVERADKKLGKKDKGVFVDILVKMQLENMKRIDEELLWFSKKYDYRFDKEPWGNSKDSPERSIKKAIGNADLEV